MGIFRGCDAPLVCALRACLTPFLLLALLAIQNGILYPSMILLSMLLHEAGHMLTARALGISLKPREQACPGFCLVYDCGSASYIKEIAVCAAGAGMSAAISAAAIVCGCADKKGGLFFIIVNISFAAFNLLPCQYLDGGGILRAALHMLLPCYTADKAADVVSDITVVLMLIGIAASFVLIRGNLSLAMIAVYLTICTLQDIFARANARKSKAMQKNI